MRLARFTRRRPPVLAPSCRVAVVVTLQRAMDAKATRGNWPPLLGDWDDIAASVIADFVEAQVFLWRCFYPMGMRPARLLLALPSAIAFEPHVTRAAQMLRERHQHGTLGVMIEALLVQDMLALRLEWPLAVAPRASPPDTPLPSILAVTTAARGTS